MPCIKSNAPMHRALFSTSRPVAAAFLPGLNFDKSVRRSTYHFLFCKRADPMTQKREEVHAPLFSAVAPFGLGDLRGLW